MDAAAWQKSLGWDESAARRTQIITGSVGLVLLFIGVVMQWWAGNNISDISLSTFCQSYSGEGDVMESSDWKKMKLMYYEKSNPIKGPLSLEKMTKQFFGGNGTPKDVEKTIYNEPAFWCKALPKCPAGAICSPAGGHKVVLPGTTTEHGVWTGRSVSAAPSWNLAPGAFAAASSHIRCWDKFIVYRDMLEEVLLENGVVSPTAPKTYVVDSSSGTRWNSAAIETAAYAALYTCYSSKGATGYILGLGPFLSSLATIFLVISLFTCCPRSYTSSLGRGLALMAFAMTLIGFWVISFISTQEFIASYMYCAGAESPLTDNKGMYFDGTPCVDRNSNGDNEMNPFLSWSAWMTGVYTFGGVFNILATIVLLVTIANTIKSDQLRKFATLTPSDDL